MSESTFTTRIVAIIAAIVLFVCGFMAVKADQSGWTEAAKEDKLPLAVSVDANGGIMEYYQTETSGSPIIVGIGCYEEVAG